MPIRTFIFLLLACSTVYGKSCVSLTDCSRHGICANSTCVCDKGWTTYPNKSSPGCNYQQKEKLTAFLLSFLVGSTGADWFYLAQGQAAYIVGGIFKLLTGLFVYFACFASCCCFMCEMSSIRDTAADRMRGSIFILVLGIISFLCLLTNAIWVTVDWIRVLAGGFNDGNGVSLKDW